MHKVHLRTLKITAMKEFLVNFLLTVRYGGLSKGGVPERWMTVAFFVASTDYYILAAATAIASVIILMSKSAPSAVRMMFLRTKTATKRLLLAHAADGAMPKMIYNENDRS